MSQHFLWQRTHIAEILPAKGCLGPRRNFAKSQAAPAWPVRGQLGHCFMLWKGQA